MSNQDPIQFATSEQEQLQYIFLKTLISLKNKKYSL